MASGNHTGQAISWTPAAERVLEVASELFYDRGINSVGVDTLAAEAGVTKKTIYDRFRSKDNLITAYLQRRDARYRGWLAQWVEERDGEPLLQVFDGLHRWLDDHCHRGCAFINAYAELADPSHDAHRIAREHKEWLRGFLRALATEGGRSSEDPVADYLLALHEGAIVLFSAGADPEAAVTARHAAAVLLAACPAENRAASSSRSSTRSAAGS